MMSHNNNSANYYKKNSQQRRGYSTLFKSWLVASIFLLAITTVSCGQAPDNKSDISWLIDVLELKEGSIVADLGAGDGDQTIEIARHLGSGSTIYSTELGSGDLQELREETEESDLDNITVIEGDPDQTNLPEACCDALFLRRVYHHIEDPASFNASLFETLKPGGRLAIIDFEPRGSEADPGDRDSGSQHGITAETAIEELKQAEFELVSSEQPSGRNIYVVMEKPLQSDSEQ